MITLPEYDRGLHLFSKMARQKPRYGGAQNEMNALNLNTNIPYCGDTENTENVIPSTSHPKGDSETQKKGTMHSKDFVESQNVALGGTLGNSQIQIDDLEQNNISSCLEESGPLQDQSFARHIDEMKEELSSHSESPKSHAHKMPSNSDEVETIQKDSQSVCTQKSVDPSIVNNEQFEKNPDLQRLLALFLELNITATPRPYIRKDLTHNDMMTQTAAGEVGEEYTVTYCKNLFLKDRKGQYYLVVYDESSSLDLKLLKQQLGAHRNLSFADETAMHSVLRIRPGEVTPFALMHSTAVDVRLAVEDKLMGLSDQQLIAFHPFDPALQVDIKASELTKIIKTFGKEIQIMSKGMTTGSKLTPEGHNAKVKSGCVKTRKDNGMESRQKGAAKEGPTCTTCADRNGTMDTPRTSRPNNASSTNDQTVCSSEELNDIPVQGTSKSGLTVEGDTGSDTVFPQEDIPSSLNLLKKNHHCELLTSESSLSSSEESVTANTAADERNLGKCEALEAVTSGDNIQTTDRMTVEIQDTPHTSQPQDSGLQSKRKVTKPIPFPRWFDRKGKLKSYLRKNTGSENNISEEFQAPLEERSEESEASKMDIESPERDAEDDYKTIFEEAQEESKERKDVRTKGEQRKDEKGGIPVVQTQILKPLNVLPDVTAFYNTLRKHSISFREVDLSNSTSSEVGPSIGCKTIPLKDRRGNVFLVITHEFYELDYGRLKKALSPRKKLDYCGPEDIMVHLGVDPCRLSPFAVAQSTSFNARMFVTRKITPQKIVLAIQHPFTSGHRILMTSSELQRFFRCLGTRLEVVDEREWPAKFDTLFTRFETEDLGNECEQGPIISQSQHAGYQEHDTNDSNEIVLESQPSIKSIGGIRSSSWMSIANGLARQSVQALDTLVHLFKRPQEVKQPELELDSSVDPCQSETSTPSFSQSMPKKKPSTTSQVDDTLCESRSTFEAKAPTFKNACPDRYGNENDVGGTESSSSSGCKINFTLEELISHLETYNVKCTLHYEKNDVKFQRCLNDARELDVIDLDVETCRLLHMKDKYGNTYMLVGGECDQLSKRKFIRRFHMSSIIHIVHSILDLEPEMMLDTPLSVAMCLLEGRQMEKPCSSVHTVAMTTSLYLDSETILRFVVDGRGASILMTSGEFERYIRALGFELWYVP